MLKNFFASIARRAAKYGGIPLRDPALKALLGQKANAAGIDVDAISAMNCSAVWQAINIIAGPLSCLPAGVFKIEGENRTLDKKHPAYRIIHEAPNDEMSSQTFHETLTAHALSWGNGYGRIYRDRKDQAEDVTVVLPNQLQPERSDSGKLQYKFSGKFEGEKDEIIPARDIIHLRGLGFDGIKGYSVVEMAKDSIGLSLACEKSGASFFGRGCIVTGALKVKNEIDEKGKKNLRESFQIMHGGSDNMHRLMVLEEDTEYEQIQMSNQDAQFLESREFSVVEIARWFNVPPHMLRDLSRATFSNIEHQGIEYLTFTLLPWLIRWQQEYKRKLFSRAERNVYEVDHDVTRLMTADTATKYAAYADGRNGGWLTLNDILRREHMNTIGAIGDTHLYPSTMSIAEHTTGEVKKTSLDGKQIESLLNILRTDLPSDQKAAVLNAVFPAFTDEQVAKLCKAKVENEPEVRPASQSGSV